jgi:hypothetical protein
LDIISVAVSTPRHRPDLRVRESQNYWTIGASGGPGLVDHCHLALATSGRLRPSCITPRTTSLEELIMRFQGAVIREQGVTFAIVIVKPHVIDNAFEADRTMASLQPVFPGMPVVLMAQDYRGVPTYYGRRDISQFMASVPARMCVVEGVYAQLKTPFLSTTAARFEYGVALANSLKNPCLPAYSMSAFGWKETGQQRRCARIEQAKWSNDSNTDARTPGIPVSP